MQTNRQDSNQDTDRPSNVRSTRIQSEFSKRTDSFVKKIKTTWHDFLAAAGRLIKKDTHQAVKSIRRVGKSKVYRLKGYTTVAKINRKRQAERQQRLLRRILAIVLIVLMAILLLTLYNPIKNFSEWNRMIGVKDLSDLTWTETSAGDTTGSANQTDTSGDTTTSADISVTTTAVN